MLYEECYTQKDVGIEKIMKRVYEKRCILMLKEMYKQIQWKWVSIKSVFDYMAPETSWPFSDN